MSFKFLPSQCRKSEQSCRTVEHENDCYPLLVFLPSMDFMDDSQIDLLMKDMSIQRAAEAELTTDITIPIRQPVLDTATKE